MEGLIGSFLLEDITSQDLTEQNNDFINESTASPSLLHDVLSRYHNIRNDHQNHHHRRIFLDGSHLMTSSLLFDFAISLASNAPCRCHFKKSLNGNSRDGCEYCIAVTVIRSVARRDDSNACPIMCRPRRHEPVVSSDSDDGTPLAFSKKRRLDNFGIHCCRFQTALRRVHIIYVNGIQDILHYLLTIASQPLSRQPLGGIFIDQLDEIFVQQFQDYREDVATTSIRMSQTGTAVFIGHVVHDVSFSVAAPSHPYYCKYIFCIKSLFYWTLYHSWRNLIDVRQQLRLL